MPKILVTGVPGWLGNTLLEKLAPTDLEIRCMIDPLFRGQDLDKLLPASCKGRIEPVFADLRDKEALASLTRGITSIYHIAAVQHPKRVSTIYQVNTNGTIALARAAAGRVEKLVFVSSCTVHGENASNTPMDESSSFAPVTHYARSKVHAELGLKQIAAETGLHTVIIRPGVFYGTKPTANLRQLIAMIQKKRLPVFGQNGRFRTYVDVGKVAEAILLADRRGRKSAAYLIGDLEPLHTREFYQTLATGVGIQPRIVAFPGIVATLAEKTTLALAWGFGLHFRMGNIVGEFGRNMFFQSSRVHEIGFTPLESSRQGLIAMAQTISRTGADSGHATVKAALGPSDDPTGEGRLVA